MMYLFTMAIRYLSELPIEDDPAMNVVGLGKSGKTDLAEKHDKYYIRHISTQHS